MLSQTTLTLARLPPARLLRSLARVRIEWLLVLILTLGTLVLRLLWLDRVPPGLHLDEAVDGFLARDILAGERPIFFFSWGGREPLYMYVMAGVFALLGTSTLTLRLTSVLIGAATLPITWLLARRLFGPRIGLLAAALLAINTLHLAMSRNGYPHILIPPLTGLSFYFLWRSYIGVSDQQSGIARRYGDWLLGGLLAGLALYTYMASRYYPVALVVIGLYALIVDFNRVRRHLPGILVAGLSFLLVIGPLAWQFYLHPRDTLDRATQVSLFTQAEPGQVPALIAQNVLQTALSFFWPGRGDVRWHFNLAGRPLLDAPLAIALLIGILVCLRNWRHPPYPFVLLWFIVSWSPGVLTLDVQPAWHRMFGALFPSIVLLLALGLDRIWAWLASLPVAHSRSGAGRALPVALVIALLLFEAWSAVQTYFVAWARDASTYYAYMGDMVDMARAAERARERGDDVVLVYEHYRHPTIVWENPATLEMRWIDNRGVLYPASSGRYVTYLFPLHNTPIEEAALAQLQATGAPVEVVVRDPAGAPAVGQVRVRQPEPPALPMTATASFNGELALADSQTPEAVRRGDTLRVMVQLAVLRPVTAARRLAAHLVDPQGQVWAQDDHLSYLAAEWRSGDAWIQWLNFRLDAAMPPGPYKVLLMLADGAAHPLPVLNPQGQPQGTYLTVGTVEVLPEGGQIETVTDQGQVVDKGLKVLESRVVAETVVSGAQLPLAITWQATAAPRSATVFEVQLVSADGTVWMQQTLPIVAAYPPSAWKAGEVIRARYVVPIPPTAPGGKSQVRLRFGPERWLTVGEVMVTVVARQFDPPPVQYPLRFTLGETIEFVGYDLPRERVAPGEILEVTLYWHAIGETRRDLKVFTHVMADATIVAQQDSVPQAGERPTTGWQPGEYIADRYRIALPVGLAPGRYRLYVGMYDAETITRLPVHDSDGKAMPEDRIPLREVTVVAP